MVAERYKDYRKMGDRSKRILKGLHKDSNYSFRLLMFKHMSLNTSCCCLHLSYISNWKERFLFCMKLFPSCFITSLTIFFYPYYSYHEKHQNYSFDNV